MVDTNTPHDPNTADSGLGRRGFLGAGASTLMRTLPEQDLARELPIGGVAPKTKR